MTSQIKPAFPGCVSADNQGGLSHGDPGMSLRDYFAAKAMAALILKVPLHDRKGEHGISSPTIEEIHRVRLDIAESAFDYADAMLSSREVKK